MGEIRLGIIGIGNMGSAHGRMVASSQVPGMVLAGVADRRPGARFLQHFGKSAGQHYALCSHYRSICYLSEYMHVLPGGFCRHVHSQSKVLDNIVAAGMHVLV